MWDVGGYGDKKEIKRMNMHKRFYSGFSIPHAHIYLSLNTYSKTPNKGNMDAIIS